MENLSALVKHYIERIIKSELIDSHPCREHIRGIILVSIKKEERFVKLVKKNGTLDGYIENVIKHYDASAEIVRKFQVLQEPDTWLEIYNELRSNAENKLQNRGVAYGQIEELAHDYATDVLLKCAEADYSYEESFKAWMGQFLKFECSNGGRKATAYKREADYSAENRDFSEEYIDLHISVEYPIEQMEAEWNLTSLLKEKFDEKELDLIITHIENEDCNCNEIIEILEISPATYHRRKKRVKTILDMIL